MEIGSSLNLSILNKGKNKTIQCECKIIGENKEYIFIDYPVNLSTRKTVILQTGTKVMATFINKYNTPFSFKTEIVHKVKLTVPALAIKLPKEGTINKIQRRKYVRVESAIDVAVHSATKSFSAFTTVSLDISGGGISIIIPNNKSLDDKKTVDLWMIIQMNSGTYHYIYAQAKIIRTVQLESTIKSASLEFTSIKQQDKQTIIQFCFEKQREARQRGFI